MYQIDVSLGRVEEVTICRYVLLRISGQAWEPDRRYNDLPVLPPYAKLEATKVLMTCIRRGRAWSSSITL